MIQRRDYASAARWMHDPIAKIIFQFQNFVIDAWHKQLMYGLNHFDLRQFVNWTMQTAVGAATAAIPGYALWSVMPEGKDKDKYFDDNLAWNRLAAKGVARASFASFVPNVVDATTVALTGEPVFAHRASGLGTTGPSLSMAIDPFLSVGQAVQSAGKAAFGDDELSQTEMKKFQRVMAFGNWLPFQIMYQAWLGDRPARTPPSRD